MNFKVGKGCDITLGADFPRIIHGFLQNKLYLLIWSHRTPYLTLGKSFQPEGQALHPLLPEDSFNSGFNLLMRPAPRSEGRQREGFCCCWTKAKLSNRYLHWLRAKSPMLTAGPKPDFHHNTRRVMLLATAKSDKATNLYKLV